MKSLVICEKPNQGRDVETAVGTRFGTILAAQGHLLTLVEPGDVDERYKTWGFDVLCPPGGQPFYPKKVDGGGGKADRWKRIRAALAEAGRVYIATDCDREGQVIGDEILEMAKFRGEAFRVIFTAQDPKTLREAFSAARPNSEYRNLFLAGEARANADLIFGMSLTRAVTLVFQSNGIPGLWGVGRVKTPTLAIVCRREKEIADFRPEDYFVLAVEAVTSKGRFRMVLVTRERITDQALAARIGRAADGYQGPLAVQTEGKREPPPRLFDLPELQKACSAKWGWGASETLDVAQRLYDERKILTYPRAETKYLQESQIAHVVPLLRGLARVPGYSGIPMGEPVIRKGKSGHFCDPCLQGVSHHAIVPNVNAAEDFARVAPTLTREEGMMFDLVARRFMASIMPDHEYQQTTVTMAVPIPGLNAPVQFRAIGRVPTKPGWKAAYGDEEGGAAERKDPDGEDVSCRLPPLADGEPARLGNPEIDKKTTQPPPRYTEGTLIDAMQNAAKFVADPALRERLKEAKGIGTPATRAEIIKSLFKQMQLSRRGKQIVPTDQGMALYDMLSAVAPRVVDPGVTAIWEMRLDAVTTGALSAGQVIAEINQETGRIMGALQARLGPHGQTRPSAPRDQSPSPAKLALARRVAEERGLALPPKTEADWRVCQAFLDENLGKQSRGGGRRRQSSARGR